MSLENRIEYGHVFATPLAVVSNCLSDHEQMLTVARDIHDQYSKTKHFIDNAARDMPAVTYWDTPDIFGKYSSLNSIASQLQPLVDQYAKRLSGDPQMTAIRKMSWLCYQDRNSFHPKHNHWASLVDQTVSVHNINAIVYLQTEPNDKLDLYWPTPIAPLSYANPSFSSSRASTVRLANNSAVIIPAWVDHGCDAAVRTTTKICLSVNYSYSKTNY